MKFDNETYNKYNTLYKYKRSILLDQFLHFIPIFALLILFGALRSNGKTIPQYVIFGTMFVFFVLYFLSDLLFKGASIGKRIYKIKIDNLFDINLCVLLQ